MRYLVVLGLLFYSLAVCANSEVLRDPDNPITPWPLEIGRQVIDVNSFGGTWFGATDGKDQWILTITPWQEGRSYHWELFLRSSPSLRSEGLVYLKDQYVIGLIQAPFLQQEFILMYLTDGKLHLKIGDEPAPRVEALFVRRTNEI